MASTKRDRPMEDEGVQKQAPEVKKSKVDDDIKKQRVVLNPADCDLDFDIEDDGIKGSALYEHGFAYCWSGARASVGITGGKYCFSLKILSAQPVEMDDTPPEQQHVCRLGISRGDDAVGSLGESKHSFGYGGTGKFSTAGKFMDYGEKFGVGDTILCAVDLESKPLASIGFSKNGKWLGFAAQFNAGPQGLEVVDSPLKKLHWESAVFPHVMLKNVVVQLQFNVEEGLVPEEGYKPWASSIDDGNAIIGPSSSSMRDSEVIMTVGLPASGKTTWAEKWMKEHPEKRFVLLGTNLFLDQMKVPGLLRKRNYGQRFDRLINQATQMLDVLLPRAAKTPRNYIIDQTNVYKSARRRKLKPFLNFHKTAVVVLPKPEELKLRAAKRFEEMGKEVPDAVLNNMIANFTLPSRDELFNEVKFVELDEIESQRYLCEMKHALPPASSPYSSENSTISRKNVSLRNQWGPSGAAVPWAPNRPSVSSPLSYGYQISEPVNSAYPGIGSNSVAYPGYQNNPIPRAPSACGPCMSDRSSCLPRENVSFSGSYSAISIQGTDPHQSVFRRPDILNDRSTIPNPTTEPNSFRSSPFGSAMTPVPHYPHGGQAGAVAHLHSDLQSPGRPTYASTSLPPAYGSPYEMARPFPYRVPHPGGDSASGPKFF